MTFVYLILIFRGFFLDKMSTREIVPYRTERIGSHRATTKEISCSKCAQNESKNRPQKGAKMHVSGSDVCLLFNIYYWLVLYLLSICNRFRLHMLLRTQWPTKYKHNFDEREKKTQDDRSFFVCYSLYSHYDSLDRKNIIFFFFSVWWYISDEIYFLRAHDGLGWVE